MSTIQVKKRSGEVVPLDLTKWQNQVQKVCAGVADVSQSMIEIKAQPHFYDGISTREIDEITARILMSMSSINLDYQHIASKIVISNLHKNTIDSFSEKNKVLFDAGLISDTVRNIVVQHTEELDALVDYSRDYLFDFFGFKTLERSYLLKINDIIVERPQDIFMRISIALYKDDIPEVAKSYNMLSNKYFTHATPTLFNMGTRRQQGASCFLESMEDSLEGIFKCITDSAKISKWAGGIGVAISDIRSKGSVIKGTNGKTDGIIPMLRVFNDTMVYINQGGKRNGSAAFYLEPHHPDILDFLDIRKNHGDESRRARDLFTAIWINDLFMERVKENGVWSLMNSVDCPDLTTIYGKEYRERYNFYESNGVYNSQMPARDLWKAIITSQIETGTPYIVNKDAVNELSNQQNIGTIKSSNLCAEVCEYTSPDEIAVCTLASICLPMCVKGNEFDYELLRQITHQVVRNLNKMIDNNFYPVPETKNSNERHRPIGMGVQGLADVYLALGHAYDSPEASEINKRIFETIYFAGLEESNRLAINDGVYSTFRGSPLSQGKFNFDLFADRTGSQVSLSGMWDFDSLRTKIVESGLRNSLLIALMPTASTSQIMGNTESFEPITTNMYTRKTLAGDFVVINKFLMKDLVSRGLWNETVKNQVVDADGSIQGISSIPDDIKLKYKTVWELKQRNLIDQSADRTPFICQSQSLNLYFKNPSFNIIHSALTYAHGRSLKTMVYYTRTLAVSSSTKFTTQSVSTPSPPDCNNCSA